MIHDWKVRELEITDFEDKLNRTPSAETEPTQTSNPSIFRDERTSNYY